MDCVCGESIREVNLADDGWAWVHDANGSVHCPDGRGIAVVDQARSG